MKLNDHEQRLLDGWEEVHSKGQATLWTLLALYESPKLMTEIKTFMQGRTNSVVSSDDKSMYRALRRYVAAELITYETAVNNKGPDRKKYALTAYGAHVLKNFCQRNITSIFYQKDNEKLIKELMK